ncbi:MAG: glycoside hydrolase domain-containing protein [Kiritimatiellia bacterium]
MRISFNCLCFTVAFLLLPLLFACTTTPPKSDGVLNPPAELAREGAGHEPPAPAEEEEIKNPLRGFPCQLLMENDEAYRECLRDNKPDASAPAAKPLPELAAGEKCFEPGTYGAVDLAQPTDQKFLELMRRHKVHTIMRYYDWEKESIRGKTPKADELARIFGSGFYFAGVFQHYNSSESTFRDASRPAIDAARILELAKLWRQPKGSAVYVGFDGDFPFKLIASYAKGVCTRIRAGGFRCGMYGSGGNCKDLIAAGLIDRSTDKSKKPLCMIAASSWAWRGTKALLPTGEYALAQTVNKKCGGKSLDYDAAKVFDFGQWVPQ